MKPAEKLMVVFGLMYRLVRKGIMLDSQMCRSSTMGAWLSDICHTKIDCIGA